MRWSHVAGDIQPRLAAQFLRMSLESIGTVFAESAGGRVPLSVGCGARLLEASAYRRNWEMEVWGLAAGTLIAYVALILSASTRARA